MNVTAAAVEELEGLNAWVYGERWCGALETYLPPCLGRESNPVERRVQFPKSCGNMLDNQCRLEDSLVSLSQT